MDDGFQMLTVCCVNVGNYAGCGAKYVNTLYRAVQKHLTVEHEFICFTDNPDGIECKTSPIQGEGWFAKLFLFKEFTEGRVIFIDLDTIITGNIDFLAKFKGDFAILRDFYRKNGYGSGIMLWKGGLFHEITEVYVNDGQPDVEGGDQIYLEGKIHKAKRLQDLYPDKIVSYKVHSVAGMPRKAAICCFHGFPHPHDFTHGWVKETWR
jgi:hypothetical protein